MPLFPAFLKLEGRACLVVGAGAVAQEKIESLLRAGAKVLVVAPQATDRVRVWARARKIRWEPRRFQPADLAGAILVVAASSSPLRRWLGSLVGGSSAQEPERGLYLWGGVGRGKTWLMDMFFESLPFPEKRRRHFHRFMHDVHTELKGLQNQESPLEAVAERMAGDTRVLCFDEFFVTDIADYAAWTLQRFIRSTEFEWTAQCADDWRTAWPDFTRTRYHAKAAREDRSSCFLIFRRL